MRKTRKVRFGTAAFKLTLAGIATLSLLYDETSAACGNDNDCKGDRICVNNQCVDPAPTLSATSSTTVTSPAPASTTTDSVNVPQPAVSQPLTTPVVYEESASASESEAEEENPASNENIPPLGPWDIWFNPMGFIQFGPTAGFEIRTANNFYVGMHGRYAAMGMLYNSLLETRAEEELNNGSYYYDQTTIEVSPQSAAVGAEFKYFIPFPGHTNMLYFGMFGEYMWGGYKAFQRNQNTLNSTDYRDQTEIYEAIHQSIGMGAMVGHRWRFGETRKVLVTAGIITGVARPFLSTKEYVSPKRTYEVPQRNEFLFMAELAIGYGM